MALITRNSVLRRAEERRLELRRLWISMGYSGSEAARDCISFLSAVKEMEVARSWETACSTRSLAVSLLGMTLKCPQAEAQMSSAVS